MNIDTMIAPLSNAISFVVLLKYSTAAVLIAFFCGMLGIWFRKDAPLGENVILIVKEARNAA